MCVVPASPSVTSSHTSGGFTPLTALLMLQMAAPRKLSGVVQPVTPAVQPAWRVAVTVVVDGSVAAHEPVLDEKFTHAVSEFLVKFVGVLLRPPGGSACAVQTGGPTGRFAPGASPLRLLQS